MASACVQLCQRCASLSCSRTMGIITLKYSTHTHCPVALRSAFSVPVLLSVLHRRRNLTQSFNSGVRSFCEFHAKVQPSQKTHRDTDESPGDSLVPYQNQLRDGGMPLNEWETALDLDDIPAHSALEKISDKEAVQIDIPATLPPVSITLKDYVDQSETLRSLVLLGVQLWKLEQRPNVGSMLLKLDFQTDVVPRLTFLRQLGVEDSRLGYLISHNPFILTESLENLQARVAYLRSKKFSAESVASMVSRAPYLLNFSVKRIDNRLGFFQQQLGLSAHKTRDVVARLPRLLCGSLEPVKENLKVCKLEMGFRENELQHIVTVIPKVLTANKRKLTQIFDYIHNTMNIPHNLIVKFPQVLNAKYLRIKERHLFLQYLEKAQYDPAKPNYISLEKLVALPDEAFCTEVASATLEDFELFQKTM
ncbi:transcription termination factor 3, mitochondrial isoform X1 [Esox lucius]|uniref:Transcription termination factor 3, mitochondrial n=1 Tax=Esox lucius TaxID=8010 RepID=A0A3P8YTQ0_ESOLU|nr:transcription termination factor 3, mitochondrial isoform X1 [Esox lucius]XP_010902318.1 transcription termination factor 3, mitochondrial isoform X1 [Esox lucius]